ncbi:hypothetical protein ABZZ79_00385 [Streptomyces sp. NPDC006458]|uniref:hypothetical protein n=1 Tax=Streptomyces sp. NPDC006458 TaxID=3154302 RepID=UPI0033B0093E
MNEETPWHCLIAEPEGSIRLPVGDATDLKAWSKQAAERYLDGSTPRREVRGLASVLARVAESAEMSDPTFVYAYVVDAAKAVTAVYEVHDYDGEGYRSVDRLPELLRDVLPTSPDRQGVEQIVLPAGPGVRIQEIQSVDTGGVFRKKTVLETVTYAVVPPQVENILVLRMSWTNLIFSEALLELAETLAQSLELAEVKGT